MFPGHRLEIETIHTFNHFLLFFNLEKLYKFPLFCSVEKIVQVAVRRRNIMLKKKKNLSDSPNSNSPNSRAPFNGLHSESLVLLPHSVGSAGFSLIASGRVSGSDARREGPSSKESSLSSLGPNRKPSLEHGTMLKHDFI